MGKFEEIINNGKKDGKSIAEINKELKEAGANFHINPDHTESGWTQEEMDEGFIPAKKDQKNMKHLQDYMRYDATKRGLTIRVETLEGVYDITWDDDGHPNKAIRKN